MDFQKSYKVLLPQKIFDLETLSSKLDTLGLIHLVRAQNFSKTNIFYSLIRTRTCAYQGIRNISFLGDLAYVLNEWSLIGF